MRVENVPVERTPIATAGLLDLRRGLERDEFRVHYQPVVALDGGPAFGVEALVRWAPEGRLISPYEFIDEAEESGLIIPLGAWVLAESCRQMAAWDAAGAGPDVLSVNLSARQLAEPGLIATVRRALGDARLAPSRLCLEITERVLVDQRLTSTDNLLALRALGVKVAIDDFGTGYSSLGYLQRFPIDVVKLDRAFVRDAGEAQADALIATIVNISRSLGMSVTAEGVETEEQVMAVRALGCQRGQGYYWSRPQPADTALAWSADGAWSMPLEQLDVVDLTAALVAELGAATGRSIVLEAGRRAAPVRAHAHLLRTALGHLIVNAVAHSPADRPILVAVRRARHSVTVTVADRGEGMTADEVARCFEQFWRSDRSRESRGGSGMGLWMARELVGSVGGRLSCASRPGRGSTFTLRLPC